MSSELKTQFINYMTVQRFSDHNKSALGRTDQGRTPSAEARAKKQGRF